MWTWIIHYHFDDPGIRMHSKYFDTEHEAVHYLEKKLISNDPKDWKYATIERRAYAH